MHSDTKFRSPLSFIVITFKKSVIVLDLYAFKTVMPNLLSLKYGRYSYIFLLSLP